MDLETIAKVTGALGRTRARAPCGRVVRASGGLLEIDGLARSARLGDRVRLGPPPGLRGEVVRIGPDGVDVLPDGPVDGIARGALARLSPAPALAPDDSWIGRVLDPDGRPLDGRPLLPGPRTRPIRHAPPPAHDRRPLGPRMETGLAVMNTLLPVVRGQRLGLFAGSGVGKSSLLAQLARGIEADVVVIALVGERGRELRHFTDDVLGPDGMARTVLVAATSDRAPQTRRRCAWAATTVAEHFRDEGRQVLLLVDSVTRFAEAHREVAVTAGEPAALRGFPASTGPQIAALCERAGPGTGMAGDITAVYSVLVAGSDMEEPVADWLRGVLDGHVVLDREIAERGRFPAIDVLRSVSRALPAAASPSENAVIGEARRHLGTWDRAALMVQSGLYSAGSDPAVDTAIAVRGPLESFFARTGETSVPASFAALRRALATAGDERGH
ncbi:FliI/YscN family ATPase [Wenxinia saemankumensis]|uniref:Flagellum-specific ATP synthase n=1 Tax=Wenxinia saemankumensis TaxID=1447782 RepID=A0A1M6G5S2_9RHOB|nr:FliI/YscN family ATPase [Wenxinia saemankumensis]SHJ05295.1 flagellum-specific ATP synthase [Wenxinia saemankumensis]